MLAHHFYEQIYTEKPPFDTKKRDNGIVFVLLRGDRPDLPRYIEERPILADVVQRCWIQEPSQRLSAAEACELLDTVSATAAPLGRGLGFDVCLFIDRDGLVVSEVRLGWSLFIVLVPQTTSSDFSMCYWVRFGLERTDYVSRLWVGPFALVVRLRFSRRCFLEILSR